METANGTTVEVSRAATTPAPAVSRPESPLTVMRRILEDFDRAFQDWGFGTGQARPNLGFVEPFSWNSASNELPFMPPVEVAEKDGGLVVRADLPGMRKEDVEVQVNDTMVVIKGHRERKQEEKREGYFRSERSYGSFERSIPLPSGVAVEDAKATFADGVLEVTMKTRTNGRTVPIS